MYGSSIILLAGWALISSRAFQITPPCRGRTMALSPPLFSTPSDVEVEVPPASSPTSKDIPSLKSSLYALCACCDRGFAASTSDRAEIETLLAQLSDLAPVPSPTAGLDEGLNYAPLKKCWKLIYTSASDVTGLGANPTAAVGGIYQDARELPTIVNVIDLSPRSLRNLPPGPLADALETSTRVKVKTQARSRSQEGRVGLTFVAVEVEQRKVLGREVGFLPPLKLQLPQLGLDLQRTIFGVAEDEDPRDADNNPAFFDVKYVDDELLVINQGSPGGMFAAVKVEDLSS